MKVQTDHWKAYLKYKLKCQIVKTLERIEYWIVIVIQWWNGISILLFFLCPMNFLWRVLWILVLCGDLHSRTHKQIFNNLCFIEKIQKHILQQKNLIPDDNEKLWIFGFTFSLFPHFYFLSVHTDRLLSRDY